MSAVKASGKGGWKRFQPDMYEQVQQQLRIRSDLRQALDPNEFLLNYQPIVEVDTGHIVGFEALIRWQHRRRGLIGPNDFIADAEHTNLIIPIGAWVLKTACAVASTMRAVVDDNDLTMSVNVSPRQLRSDDIVDVVRAALKEAGLPPAALCLEITESVLAEDPSIIERLKTLRALGVHLAIDDFGTGFSSYGHLQRLPIDTIKIDRSFVERLGPDQPAPAVAYGIIQMSLAMGLRTVAEGVETPEQRAVLQALGCPFAQGFLFSRPVDETNALALLVDQT
jgi:EAL domain-containing protein (putative c-di-GMP-specific phosphodiesterase class I)